MNGMKKLIIALGLTIPLLFQACSDPRMQSIAEQVWMVKIVVNPLQSSYTIGQAVNLDYVVLDWHGNILHGIAATWQTPPEADVLHLGDNNFEFSQIGSFQWTVTLADPHGQSDSVTLLVPAVPTSVDIIVDPAQDYYIIGDQVAFDYIVYNQEGGQMTGVQATWLNPPPAQATNLGNQEFDLISEGYISWTVTLEDPYGLSDTETLTVDGTGPGIDLIVPERGDTIRKLAAQAEVTVSGLVTDAVSGLDTLTITTNVMSPTEVVPQLDGSFSLVTPAAQGLNIVKVEAADAVGNITTITRAYHYASDFFAYQNDVAGRTELENLSNVWITEVALDRGRPNENPPYDPCSFDASDQYVCSEIRDIASLLELALNSIDFAASQTPLEFNFPIIDEAWEFNLADFADVKASLEGDFDLVFGFGEISAGLAKVEDLASYDGGIHAAFAYYTHKDSNQVDHPGMNLEFGMTATLTFNVFIDLVATDPLIQIGLCLLADNLCNSNPPFDCLADYLVTCNQPGQATPIAQLVSYIDSPVLAGLAVSQMTADVDMDIGLSGATGLPEVTLADLAVALGQGTLDISALEDVTINIGTISFASFSIDLGTWQFPTTFISDLADQLLDPLVNALKPLLEIVFNQFFTCSDPQNPLCYVIPFLEDFLGAFAVEQEVEILNPFDESHAATTQVSIKHNSLEFTRYQGGDMKLSARIDSLRDQALDNHSDDDLLGIALADGCFSGQTEFTGFSIGSKTIQLADALDLVNMNLFAIWNNAGLDINLGAADLELPPEQSVSALSVSLSPWLPPMLSGCATSAEEVLVEMGDLQVAGSLTTLAGNEIAFTGFVSVIYPGTLQANAAGDGVEVV
ncbi:MAG: hypothetical protein JRJ87_26075, partial [Deltaproteobacteria bacterium]|nr:hypothetical protein [Deltaproteobacteria bacterium]